MKRRMLTMLVLFAVVAGGVFGWKTFVGMQAARGMQAAGMPAVTVSTAEVQEQRWTPGIPAVGSLQALQGVDVTPQLPGSITSLHFESGDSVKAGQLLVQQYTADDEAQLAGLEADTKLAELNLERSRELLPKNLISKFEFDAQQTTLERARAAEKNLRLVIAQKSIRAPFSGRLGLRQVNLGQYVAPGDVIVRLESIDQMLVDFPVAQRHVGDVHIGQPLTVTVDAWPGQQFTGKVLAIEPQIRADTRTLIVQAAIDNPDGRLLPGMFATIQLSLGTRDKVITVPQAAITYSPYGDSVYVVRPDPAGADGAMIVQNVFVVTGASRGDQIAIDKGLEPGMTVVTSGQQKLRNGALVVVDNRVPVSNQPAPAADNN